MIRVNITRKDGALFSGVFDTEAEAEQWVKNHKVKGKDAQIITTPNKIEGAKFLEKVDGPMGVKLIKQELPAEYEVEYIDKALYDRENKMDTLREERDKILCATDWLFISDVKIDQKHRKLYMTYRQYLRYLPRKIGDTAEIKIEPFENWLRRLHPEEFMDGGDHKKIIKKFKYYL